MNGLTILRYEDPTLGPRKLPAFNDIRKGKVDLEEGKLSIDAAKNEVYVETENEGKVSVGNAFIYVVE